ncbi:hypothetical protein ACIQSO_03690 [Pseudomonas putida]|uniref:hypothetical protein n=1 Tax=Pseudomonas putida TaxID=303 RepID=UPI00383B5CE0
MNQKIWAAAATRADLAPPKAIGALPDGLLPVAVADQDLAVEVRWFEDLHELGKLQLLWNGDLYGDEHEVTGQEALDPSTVFTFTVEQAELQAEGTSSLAYRFTTYPGSNPYDSIPVDIRVDRTAPGGGALPKLIFAPDIISGGVTSPGLDDQGRLSATLQAYEQKQVGDVIQPLIAAIRGGPPELFPDTPIRVTSSDQNAPVTVYFNLANLLLVDDGPAAFTYIVTDRAGNPSITAPAEDLAILLNNAPGVLLPPTVPLYDEHGLIDEATARLPVRVHIPRYDHAAADDVILFKWGNVPAQAYRVTDPNLDPLLTPLFPYRLVQLGGNGEQILIYEVERNGVSLGESTSTVVEVDISLPGGQDPDPETPENENLALPVALGASGVENIISLADRLQEAHVIIEWFGVDGTPVFIENDRVVADWGNLTLPTYQVDANDVINQQPLRLPVSPQQMKAAGPGTLRLRYSVTRDLPAPPGYSNSAYSGHQVIVVADAAGLPGGGAPLPPGDFPEKNQYNTINNDAAIDGTPYEIKLDYVNAAVGDIIEFKFRGHTGAGDDPALDPARPIEGSYTEDRHEVTQDDLDRGSHAFNVAPEYLNRRPGTWSANGYHWISNQAGSAPGDAYYHVLVDVYLPTPSTAQASTKKRFSVAATLAALWSWLRCK